MSILTRLASGTRTPHRDATRATPTDGVRAPIVGTANLQYTGRGLPQVPNWDAQSAVEQGYLGHPAVYAAVRTIADTAASLPFRAGLNPRKPAEFNEDAPLARLLGPPISGQKQSGPNPNTSSRALWAWSIAQRIVTGRMGWELEYGARSKKIVNLWPLVSSYLQPIPTVIIPGQPRPTAYFDKYRYNLPDGFIDLPANNVFYSWRPSQTDWRQAETVMQAARIPISIAVALNRYQWAMLNNGMSGRKMVVTSPFAEDDHRRAFQEQFLSELTGFDNAGKPVFAEATSDIDPSTQRATPPTVQVIDLAQTSTDAELMALMEYVERAIYKAFAVPESEIGDASQRTYSNASEEYRVFWTRTMVPLLAEIADDINTYLAPELGDEVGWFDLSGVEALRPARLFADIAPDNAANAGLIVAGEWRQDVGLPWELPAGAEPLPEPETTDTVDDPEIAPGSGSSSSGRAAVVDVGHTVIDRIEAMVQTRRAAIAAGARVDEGAAGDYKARHLIEWFNAGAGGQIDWGGPGDLTACHAVAMRHMPPDKAWGFCQNRHEDVLGKPNSPKDDRAATPTIGESGPELWIRTEDGSLRPIPNERDAAAAAVETESGTAGLLLPTGPARKPKPVQAHIFRPSKKDRRKCGVEGCGKSVTAAGHLHTGGRATPDIGSTSTMVALYPPQDTAQKIAVAAGLPASELHVTLAYLGNGLTATQLEAARTVVQSVAKEHAPLAGTVGGLGQFPAGEDGVPHYAPVDVPNLADMRTRLVQRLTDAGVPVAADHGFTPHMTLTYLKDGVTPPDPVATTKVGFGGLVLKHGSDATVAQFEGARAAGDIVDHIAALTSRRRHRGPHLPVKGGHANTPERARQAVRKMVDRHVSTVESHMAGVLRNLFDDQGKATVSRMRGKRGTQMIRAALRAASDGSADGGSHEPTPSIDPAHIFDTEYWMSRTSQDVSPIMSSISAWVPGHFATHTPGVADVDDDSAAAGSVQDLLAQATNRIAGQVTQETFDQLTKALTDGVVAGDGYSGLADRVQQVFDDASRTRAETIARTEVQSAVNSAQDTYAANLPDGVVGQREWLATPDDRTRPAHAAAEGQQQPLGHPFDVGGADLMFPGDPAGPPDEVINCRCVLIYLPA